MGVCTKVFQSGHKQEQRQVFVGGLLLWGVDPDDVQVAVIHTFFVFVGVACAPLGAFAGWLELSRFMLKGDTEVVCAAW